MTEREAKLLQLLALIHEMTYRPEPLVAIRALAASAAHDKVRPHPRAASDRRNNK